MANLDTRDKRGSALGIDLPWAHIWPNPDGAINVNDRQQIAGKYAGTLVSGLDTRNKRGSAIGIDFSWLHIYPDPDGAISQLDRQQIAYKYAGISASGGTPSPTGFDGYVIRMRRHRR